jgi:outer membrane protein assembly factor BamE
VAGGASRSGMMRPMIIPHRIKARLPGARGAALVLIATLLGGCVYRMNIQQGNYLEGKTVDKLEVGMTRTQVRYLLGTPMVPGPFDKDRWDYLYYFQSGKRLRKPEERHLVVFFKDDKVTKFERDNVPASAPQAPDQGAPIEKFPKI